MPRKTPKSPQQKKALSLAKDRSGYFFNNEKAARKTVPLRKALEHRRIRHENNQALFKVDRVAETEADLIESSTRQNTARKGGWRKGASQPLGDVIERGLESRAQRIGRKIRARFARSNDS